MRFSVSVPVLSEQIIVTEIPYQVNKATMIEKIAELVRDKRIEGISDIQDYSDRTGMRIWIQVKRDAAAQVVLNRLYKPLGMRTGEHVDYAPHAVRFAGLSPTKAELLSHARSQDTDRIHLYADASAPTKSPEDWDAYQRRLQLLATLEIS